VLPPSFVPLPEIRTLRDLTGTRLMPIRDRAREWQRPAVMAGARIGEVSSPTRYAADSSSISLRRSIRYGLGVLRTCTDYRLHRHGERRAGRACVK
jgi:hypothetical protein